MRWMQWKGWLAAVAFAGCMDAQKPAVLRVDANDKAAYSSVQAAIDHSPAEGAVVLIAPGIYREKLHAAVANLRLVGTGVRAQDVLLTWDDSAGTAGGTSKSATLTATGDGFAAENLTIENSWELTHERAEQGAQAVALLVTGDRDVLDRVRLLGAQDTLYANSARCRDHADADGHRACEASRQYFRDCYIEGHVDFIFGDAKAVFDHCELHPREHAQVMLTAQSKWYPEEDSGYYFLGCRVTGATHGRKIALGRPWRDYSTVLFVDTYFEPTITADGWSEWSGRLKMSTYREYGSTGPGANAGHRIVSSPELTPSEKARLTPRGLLAGTDRWDPEAEAAALRSLVPSLRSR
ncbi:pectinesterase family protein [Granulicella cerasi]|uniref:Pectinesterase family protein n=1 Tax=Granulicella cerasi TaxID=741063 RepID=A0ABW1ZF14_9BACT|nr:pectinesterase family protein [Granulicella cerasi]